MAISEKQGLAQHLVLYLHNPHSVHRKSEQARERPRQREGKRLRGRGWKRSTG